MLPRQRQRFPLLAVFAACFTVSPVMAQVTLDQSQTEPVNLGSNLNNAFAEVGQTYTAGLTGALAGINVDISSFTSAAIRLSVYEIKNGQVGSAPLGFTEFLGSKTIDDLISFPAFIPQIAGTQYALVATVPGQPLNPAGYGIWSGRSEDVYAGGYYFGGLENAGDPNNQFGGDDLRFRTYVNVGAGAQIAPEMPSGSLLTVGACFGGCLLLRRKFRASN